MKSLSITPLYKSGDAFLVNNYRPVSVLPIISKIIERHVFNSFYDYLNANHLLTEHQSGLNVLDQGIRVKRLYTILLTNGFVTLMLEN